MASSEHSPVRDLRYQQAYECVSKAGGAGATLVEIGECLGVKVSPYLRDVMDEMVGFGWVSKTQSMIKTKRGLRMGWLFVVVPGGTS